MIKPEYSWHSTLLGHLVLRTKSTGFKLYGNYVSHDLLCEHRMADSGDKIYPAVMINIDVIPVHFHRVNKIDC